MKAPLVFFAYPQEFKSYQKFERKACRILARMNEFQVACSSDVNGFIERLETEMPGCRDTHLEELSSLIPRLTHAIIFNSHGDLDEIVQLLEQHEIKTRVIQLSLVKVVNVDKGHDHDTYIGRGSTWGNPYAVGFDGDREEVIRKFSYDFERGFLRFSKDDVLALRGKRLGCHCKPSPCHGDVLANYLNSIDDGT